MVGVRFKLEFGACESKHTDQVSYPPLVDTFSLCIWPLKCFFCCWACPPLLRGDDQVKGEEEGGLWVKVKVYWAGASQVPGFRCPGSLALVSAQGDWEGLASAWLGAAAVGHVILREHSSPRTWRPPFLQTRLEGADLNSQGKEGSERQCLSLWSRTFIPSLLTLN